MRNAYTGMRTLSKPLGPAIPLYIALSFFASVLLTPFAGLLSLCCVTNEVATSGVLYGSGMGFVVYGSTLLGVGAYAGSWRCAPLLQPIEQLLPHNQTASKPAAQLNYAGNSCAQYGLILIMAGGLFLITGFILTAVATALHYKLKRRHKVTADIKDCYS
jgi:hypothetical protein